MFGKWKIAIILEAGYQILKLVENEESCVKLTDQIYFQSMLFPYPYSQPLTAEELECFCYGLKLISSQIEKLLQKAEQLFAIFGMKEVQEELVDDDIQALIDERLEARKAKNFARSDEIRELLKAQGIVLEDTAQGTRWRRA